MSKGYDELQKEKEAEDRLAKQMTAWKLLLNLNGMDPLPEVVVFAGANGTKGLLAGCKEARPSGTNVVYVKVRETENRERFNDFENDSRCRSVSFSEVTHVEVRS